ncbi:MAG: hypothetical protein HWE27_00445 [Gammaproteobacteria bacterium]|nr:hypothetical protein [Gammaproteobacteria bacterium]
MEYWLVSFLFSLFVVVSLPLFEGTPVRFRLFFASSGIIVWFIPWTALVSFFSQYLDPAILNNSNFLLLSIKVSAENANEHITSTNWALVDLVKWIPYLLLSVGIALLTRNFYLFHCALNNAEFDVKRTFYLRFGFLSRRLTLKRSKNATSAYVYGLINWVVVIPYSYSSSQISAALHHEFNHIRSGDTFWVVALTVLKCIFWWNPLVTYLCRQLHYLLEVRCDEQCVKRIGRNNYMKILAELTLAQSNLTESTLTESTLTEMSLSEKRLAPYRNNASLMHLSIRSKHLSLMRKRLETLNMNITFHWKQKVYLTLISLFTLITLSVPVIVKAQQNNQSQQQQHDNTITFLKVDYQVHSETEKSTMSIETSFKGASDKVEILRKVTRDLPVDITTNNDDKGRHIELVIRDKDSYNKVVEVFAGTEIEQVLNSIRGKKSESSRTIALNIGYQQNEDAVQTFELHSKNQSWVEFKSEHYQLEIMPTLKEVDGQQQVLINARIMDISDGKSVVISEPGIMTLIGSEASIEVGQEDSQGRFTGFKMSVLPTLL